MSAPATVSDFLDVCRKSGVVEENRLTALAGAKPDTPVAAAKVLLRAGVLTKFQATQLLAGKYKGMKFDRLKILDRIGAGGMGTVFLCEHTGLRKQVAVKVLPPDQAIDEGTRERFFREARAAAALDHPNIVRVYDANTANGIHYIVMEYVEGRDLQTHLNKYGPLPFDKACTYIAQAALGLQHASEKGIVHRDIKPANLLVDKDGVVKILDMGLAIFHDDDKDKLTARYDKGAILGTADYMAPEQVLASSQVDGRADIYSLGVTLYALINGKPPFAGNTTQKMAGHTSVKATSLTQIRREVPKGLSAVVDRMMAKNPNDRYQAPAEVVSALSPWLDAETIPVAGSLTGKLNPLSGVRRPRSKAKGIAIIAAVAVSAVVFGGLGMWALSGGSDAGQPQAAAQSPRTPPAPTPPATNPNRPVPPKVDRPVPVVARAATRPAYEIDFGKQAFTARFEQKEVARMDGTYPAGWRGQSWRETDVSEVGRAEHNGSGCVAVRTLIGLGSAELFTDGSAPPFRLTPGRTYTVRLDYAVTGQRNGNMEFRFDGERPPVKHHARLTATGGQWRSLDYTFTAPPHDRFQLYFVHWQGVDPDAIYLRSFRVFEGVPAAPAMAQGRPVYRLDLSKLSDAVVEASGGIARGDGKLPQGIDVYTWGKDSKAEGAVATEAGSRALTLRSTAGPPTAMLFGPYVDLEADRDYRISVEYRLTGSGGATIKIDESLLRGRDLKPLPPTGGDWATVDVVFRAAATIKGAKLEFGYGGTNVLAIRNLEVADLGPVPAPAAVLYKSDFAATGPFALRKSAGRPESLTGQLPAGLTFHPWDPSTDMEVAGVRDGDDAVVRVRNLSGKASTMIFTPDVPVRAGTGYWVRIEYKGEPHTVASVKVLSAPAKARDIGQLVTTRGTWKTVYMPYQLAAGEGGAARIEIHPQGVGADKGITLRSIEVTQAGTAGESVFQFSAADGKPFKTATDAQTLLHLSDTGLPAGWYANSWRDGDVGEVGVAEIAGKRGLFLQNNPDTTSVQTWTTAVPDVKVGVPYTVKVTYFAEPQAAGHLDVRRNGDPNTRFGSVALQPTDGRWQQAEVTVTPAEAGRMELFYQSFNGGPETRLAIHRIEITGPAASAPAPVAARDYRLNLAGARPFARRYKGDAIVESQGDGDLPAGWAGKTANAETQGDVFIDTVGGSPAIGVRNHEGPPAVRLFTPAAVVPTTTGKQYAVKVIYQTEVNGRGWVAVGIGNSEVHKLDLISAVGAWRDAEVTVTAPAAGGLTLTVGGESVGSDASVYIKGVEVRELP